MDKNVKIDKLNFRTKTMNKTNFSVGSKNILDKTETPIKGNQFYKNIVCIVCNARMWVSTAILFF